MGAWSGEFGENERLIEEAQRLTGTQERTALIHEGLRALIARDGELACGNLKNAGRCTASSGRSHPLGSRPARRTLHFIEQRRLMGRGIGWVDVHLLASVMMTEAARLWTRDERLGAIAAELRIGRENG